MALERERIALLAVLALAALGCLIGLIAEPADHLHGGTREQLLDLLHVAGTTALVLSLLLGPGLAWRALGETPLSLGFLFLPGFALLACCGGLAWALAGSADPRAVCFAVAAPLLLALAGTLVWAPPGELLERDERRCLLVAGCALGLAVAKALWSLGPEGELYAGTISRTLEVGDRSDSRISFIIPTLAAHAEGPYGPLGSGQFSPYNFSSRGPLPGLASTPLVLLSGGRPAPGFPDQPWAPFDAQGFMAYRLAMMSFACTAFLALWDLVRRLAGGPAAYFAVLLAATTPFLVHEIWFTWPKMLAAAFVGLAAICVISGRAGRAGLLAGAGYLMHPVALLSLPALALIALWPMRGAVWGRPQVKQLLLLGAGTVAFGLAWRLINGDHYDQSGFLNYFEQAGSNPYPPLLDWLEYRLKSVANTLVPLLLPIASATSGSINVVGGESPGTIHFFFQYWNGVPFGLAIVFLPLLVVGLWRAARRWPWAVFATVLVPFLAFAVYWGASSTGMMREGLQTWTLTLIAVLACEQAATGFGWLRSAPVRALLALRALEVLAVATVPVLVTREQLISDLFTLTDAVAIAAMLAFTAALGALVWSSSRVVTPSTRDK
jgi:hypothetical protein